LLHGSTHLKGGLMMGVFFSCWRNHGCPDPLAVCLNETFSSEIRSATSKSRCVYQGMARGAYASDPTLKR